MPFDGFSREDYAQKLINEYKEAGVPAWRRQWLPLAYLGDELVFAGGLGMAANCLDTPGGLMLSWEGPE